MRAVGELHLALGRLRLSPAYEPDQDSVFVQVTDLDFLIAELPDLLRRYELLNPPARIAAVEAIAALIRADRAGRGRAG